MESDTIAADTDLPIVIVVVVLVAIAGTVWFLNSPAPVQVIDAFAEDTSVAVSVGSCGGDLSLDVYEDDGLVRVRVLDHRFRLRFAGDDCLDGLTIPLSAPLGDRILIDDATGEHVAVGFGDF